MRASKYTTARRRWAKYIQMQKYKNAQASNLSHCMKVPESCRYAGSTHPPQFQRFSARFMLGPLPGAESSIEREAPTPGRSLNTQEENTLLAEFGCKWVFRGNCPHPVAVVYFEAC